jgi:hypothetical protein
MSPIWQEARATRSSEGAAKVMEPKRATALRMMEENCILTVWLRWFSVGMD